MAHLRKNKTVRTRDSKTNPVRAAEEFGIDISAIKDNLRRSSAERIRRHQIALNSIEKLRRANKPIGQDSGFFVNNKGHIVTNLHVIEGTYPAAVKTLFGTENQDGL